MMTTGSNGVKRILWISDSPLLGTGFGRATREITIRLAKLPGWEIAVLGFSFDGWPYEDAEFPARIYPSGAGTFGSDNFERAFSHFKPDIVVTLAEVWMVEWLANHPLRPQFKWIAYVPLDGGPFYPPWESILRGADELVAMSDFGRNLLRQAFPSRNIRRIYLGTDLTVFRPLAERQKIRSGERFRGKYIVGCVARNQPRKSIPSLVRAFSTLAKRIPELHLYLHLDPCDVGYDIVTLLHRYGLEGRADISGPNFDVHHPLPDEHLNVLYNLFDVMVLPTAGEGFGIPIIESFAAVIPVITTDCSACTELVSGRGELVSVLTTVTTGTNLIEQVILDVDHLAEQIEKMYRDPALGERHVKSASAFVQNLAWDNLLPEWLETLAGY
jgi:glycosyltransferase involved in cell wall biosynthesis